MTCLILGSCVTTKIIDTACVNMPKGTAHRADTLGTLIWMRNYETNRQRKCENEKA